MLIILLIKEQIHACDFDRTFDVARSTVYIQIQISLKSELSFKINFKHIEIAVDGTVYHFEYILDCRHHTKLGVWHIATYGSIDGVWYVASTSLYDVVPSNLFTT